MENEEGYQYTEEDTVYTNIEGAKELRDALTTVIEDAQKIKQIKNTNLNLSDKELLDKICNELGCEDEEDEGDNEEEDEEDEGDNEEEDEEGIYRVLKNGNTVQIYSHKLDISTLTGDNIYVINI